MCSPEINAKNIPNCYSTLYILGLKPVPLYTNFWEENKSWGEAGEILALLPLYETPMYITYLEVIFQYRYLH